VSQSARSPRFVITAAAGGRFMFNLIAANNEVLFTSELYARRADALVGIGAVRENAANDRRYLRKEGAGAEPYYFVLRALNNEVLGRSEMYSSERARDDGIEAMKAAAPIARIYDVDGTALT
jgi:uncharacterized protein